MTLKTIFVDGDKGGVGKSLITRSLVDMYLQGADQYGMARVPDAQVVVVDADRSNPDVCGQGGLTAGGRIIQTLHASLEDQNGWMEFVNQVETYLQSPDQETRIIVSMPAQIGPRAFDNSIPIVREFMRDFNVVPVWVLSRTRDSIDALDYRLKMMPSQYCHGLVVKNTFWGLAEKFGLWEQSTTRRITVESGDWAECEFPELSDVLMAKIGRIPFHIARDFGSGEGPLGLGHRMVLDCWRRAAWEGLALVEIFGNGEAGVGDSHGIG